MDGATFSLSGVDLSRPFALEIVGPDEGKTLETVANLRAYLRGLLPQHLIQEIESSPGHFLLEVRPPAHVKKYVMDAVGQAMGPIMRMFEGMTVTARRRNG